MSSKDGLSIPNLDKWQEWLKGLESGDVDRMKSRVLRSVAFRGLEVAQDNTPRRTGRLAGSLSVGDKDNIFEIKVGKTSWVFFGTAVEYAGPVNDGYEQKAGRFVPGFWRSGTFHYQPGAKSGMVIAGKIIEGAHFMEKAIQALESGDADKITEFEFQRLYAELFK
jgi:hypothetical protein